VWNVNSTGEGGGVAEMLRALLAYASGAGIDIRWLVLDGNPEFFAVTKRIHNRLHGDAGDGGALDDAARAAYLDVQAHNLVELERLVRPGDIVLLHDPQTAGLAANLRAKGAYVVWRCHVGVDEQNALTRQAWTFLRDLVAPAHAVIFSREQFAPAWIDRRWLRVIPPSLDPFSPKNEELAPRDVAGLVARSHATDDGPPPPAGARTVLQVSRWDRLKDMSGLLVAFAQNVAVLPDDVHLVLAGPQTDRVQDDPEATAVLAGCRELRQGLAPAVRSRIHLLSLPMADLDDNARMVNALQREASVVVQKSLAEGFGLTVTEPMWKGRPVIASAVGGIRDQIEDGVSGILLQDPRDHAELVDALRRVLEDQSLSDRLGKAARERIRDRYLADRHLIQYVELFASLIS
jgi:trehalose synthase